MKRELAQENTGEACLREIFETMKQLIAGVETKIVDRAFPEARARAAA